MRMRVQKSLMQSAQECSDIHLTSNKHNCQCNDTQREGCFNPKTLSTAYKIRSVVRGAIMGLIGQNQKW